MFTPSCPLLILDRVKRPRLQKVSPSQDPAIIDAIDRLQADQIVPDHNKCPLIHLLDNKDQMMAWKIEKNRELTEVATLCAENELLRKSKSNSSNCELPCNSTSLFDRLSACGQRTISPNLSESHCEVKERERSVVIIGLQESPDPSASARISHDLNCVNKFSTICL